MRMKLWRRKHKAITVGILAAVVVVLILVQIVPKEIEYIKHWRYYSDSGKRMHLWFIDDVDSCLPMLFLAASVFLNVGKDKKPSRIFAIVFFAAFSGAVYLTIQVYGVHYSIFPYAIAVALLGVEWLIYAFCNERRQNHLAWAILCAALCTADIAIRAFEGYFRGLSYINHHLQYSLRYPRLLFSSIKDLLGYFLTFLQWALFITGFLPIRDADPGAGENPAQLSD